MRTILKGREPTSLTEHRCTPGTDYDGYRDKDTLRAYLEKEQRGLCCYCLQRIRAEIGQMKVEHWHCQDDFPAEQLDYANLLGACMGNEGQCARDQHCDTRKGNRNLSRNPASPAHRVEEVIRFPGDGRIVSDDPAFDTEINEVLNLNLPFLVKSRKETLTAFQTLLEKRGQLGRNALEKLLQKENGESGAGELREYCQVIVYWLRKRLSRA